MTIDETYVNSSLDVHGRLVATATTADLGNPQVRALI